jgi:hypothetical protein
MASAPALSFCPSTDVRYVFTFETLNFNIDAIVNTELHCVQLSIRYISIVTTLLIHPLSHGTVYCHVVRWVLLILEQCSEVFDNNVRMLSSKAVLGCHGFGLPI